jgi:hypothetical protein
MEAKRRMENETASVLLLSMREAARGVGYCALYEFEYVLEELFDVEVVAPRDVERLHPSRRVYRMARMLGASPDLAGALPLGRPEFRAQREYDMFLAVFNHTHELYALRTLADYRKHCRTAICYLGEAWGHNLPGYLLELLRDFDHIFCGIKSACEGVAKITGRPCGYVPMGIDAVGFCPYPEPPTRSIDVCQLGRRSPVTHEALLAYARQQHRFYYYDTVRTPAQKRSRAQLTFEVTNIMEHRSLLANLLKRSRYFIANRAYANLPSWTAGVHEIATRYYEGAAAGTVMLGEPPDSDEFRSQFGWPDAVVRTPFDAPDVADVIARLDADPERVAAIRRNGVVGALERHDWAHRLQVMLEAIGRAPSARMAARRRRLAELAELARAQA